MIATLQNKPNHANLSDNLWMVGVFQDLPSDIFDHFIAEFTGGLNLHQGRTGWFHIGRISASVLKKSEWLYKQTTIMRALGRWRPDQINDWTGYSARVLETQNPFSHGSNKFPAADMEWVDYERRNRSNHYLGGIYFIKLEKWVNEEELGDLPEATYWGYEFGNLASHWTSMMTTDIFFDDITMELVYIDDF